MQILQMIMLIVQIIKNKNKMLICNTDSKNNEQYNLSISKPFADKIISNLEAVSKAVISDILPNMGSGPAAGAIGSTALKVSPALPPLQRPGFVAGTTFIGAISAQSWLEIGAALSKNFTNWGRY
jgi:hypothetical protein